MARIEESVEIKRLADRVFAYTTEAKNWSGEVAVDHTRGRADVSGPRWCWHHVQRHQSHDGPQYEVDGEGNRIRAK